MELLEAMQFEAEIEGNPDEKKCAERNREPEKKLAQQITINQTHWRQRKSAVLQPQALAAAMHLNVAQIFNLLYRGFLIRRAQTVPMLPDIITACRMQFGDTADCKS